MKNVEGGRSKTNNEGACREGSRSNVSNVLVASEIDEEKPLKIEASNSNSIEEVDGTIHDMRCKIIIKSPDQIVSRTTYQPILTQPQ